eukprot:14315810-Ditylum_brightwellii.AAC.1
MSRGKTRLNKIILDYLQFTTDLWRPVSAEGQEGDAATHLGDEGGEEEDRKISKALQKKDIRKARNWKIRLPGTALEMITDLLAILI